MSAPSPAPSAPVPAARAGRWRGLQTAAATLAALVLAYAALGYFAVEPLLHRYLPQIAQSQLGSHLEMGPARFDPWRWKLSLQNLRLSRRDGTPLAGADQIDIDLQASSLVHWAWVLDEIRLSAPRVAYSIDAQGRSNWDELLAALRPAQAAPDTAPAGMPRLRVAHAVIDKGTLTYADQRGPAPASTTLQAISLDIEKLSTLRDETGLMVLEAALAGQGGSLRWRGDLTPAARTSKGELEVKDLQLARVAALSPALASALPGLEGALGARLAYELRWVAGPRAPHAQLQLTQATGSLQRAALTTLDALGAPVRALVGQLQLNVPHVSLALVSPLKVDVPEVSVSAREVEVAQPRGAGTAQAQGTRPAFVQPVALRVQEMSAQMAVHDAGGAPGVQGLQAQLQGLSLRTASESAPLASLASLRVENLTLDAARRKASAGSVLLSGLRTEVLRGADGATINWQQALQMRPAAAPAGAAGPAAGAAPPWQASLGRLLLEDANLRVEDRTLRTPARLDVRGARVELRNLSMDTAKPVPLQAKLPLAQGGSVEVSGRIAPLPFAADLQLRANGIDLRPAGPYLSQQAFLRLDGGLLDARGRLSLNLRQGLSGNFRGGVAVRQLAISEEGAGTPFLAWQSVGTDTLRVDLSPLKVEMQTLRVVRPVGKFIIHEDGSLNVTHLMRPAPAAANTPRQTATPGMRLGIERVSVDNASLEFADLTLRPQFGAQMQALSGVITGLSNDPRTVAQVELDGRVEDYGSARVRGTVQPFKATEFTDLKLTFRNLDMRDLTPYSGKFAGRRIESGRLSVDLEYKIKDRQLAGQNKFVIERIKLGERVDSPTALNLPLDLAIAVLEDSEGVIDLDLPVSGSLDDPEFSYGRVVWKAIVNVLTRIVTAPFRALGNLLGGHADQLQGIDFEAGSAVLAPQEQEKLLAVSQALAKRPALKLAIVPVYDAALDTTALQEQAMRRAVLADAGVRLQADELPGPLDLFNTRIQSAIERQLKARTTGGFSFKAFDNLRDSLRQAKPEDRARYQAMLEQLRATFPISEAQLQSLAQERAQALKAHLLEVGRLPAARLEIMAAQASDEKVSQSPPIVRMRLELRASEKAPEASAGAVQGAMPPSAPTRSAR